ncbi:unnamed protein product [Moneuplotes crassus]|uniref:Uncharacterized protein n=1 Tax=Euplotes crassus TaxID=5936 RepID=A0AAD2D8D6_EUPCR|nr:unnamed protein product [Moneuplotes crassus]
MAKKSKKSDTEEEKKEDPKKAPAEEGKKEGEETEEEIQKRLEEEEKAKIEAEKLELRKQKADQFETYLKESGISQAFQIVFAEIIAKGVPDDKVFTYAAARLRALKKELDNAE